MRVCITGLGAFTPSGTSVDALMRSLLRGESAVRAMDADESLGLSEVAGAPCPEPTLADLGGRRLGAVDAVSTFGVIAGLQALTQAEMAGGLDRASVAVAWGSSFGGMTTLDTAFNDLYRRGTKRVRPTSIPNIMPSAPAFHIAQQLGLLGPSMTVSAACASSALAIIQGCRLIALGEADAVLAGGSESMLTAAVRRAWQATFAIALADAESPHASCRPFSARRNGFAMGEGGAALMLESEDSARRRGATVLGWVRGYGHTTDSGHILVPDAARQVLAMRAALRMAGADAADVAYINAHGTATPVGDLSEGRALKEVFSGESEGVPVSATKALHGHLIGAAGSLEAIVTLEALRRRHLPGNPFSEDLDPELAGLNVFRDSLSLPSQDSRLAMSNSFAFGGVNTSLVLESA